MIIGRNDFCFFKYFSFFTYLYVKMTQIIQLSKKPLGRTANLFTAQLFCGSLYCRVLSPFKLTELRYVHLYFNVLLVVLTLKTQKNDSSICSDSLDHKSVLAVNFIKIQSIASGSCQFVQFQSKFHVATLFSMPVATTIPKTIVGYP